MAVQRFPIRGDIDMANVPDLQTKLDALISTTNDDIVLDCKGLTFIDSTGIAMFVFAHQALEARGRECRVENMDARVRRPFDILGLTDRLRFSELDRA